MWNPILILSQTLQYIKPHPYTANSNLVPGVSLQGLRRNHRHSWINPWHVRWGPIYWWSICSVEPLESPTKPLRSMSRENTGFPSFFSSRVNFLLLVKLSDHFFLFSLLLASSTLNPLLFTSKHRRHVHSFLPSLELFAYILQSNVPKLWLAPSRLPAHTTSPLTSMHRTTSSAWKCANQSTCIPLLSLHCNSRSSMLMFYCSSSEIRQKWPFLAFSRSPTVAVHDSECVEDFNFWNRPIPFCSSNNKRFSIPPKYAFPHFAGEHVAGARCCQK